MFGFVCFFVSGQNFKTFPFVRTKNTQTENENSFDCLNIVLIHFVDLHVSETVISTSMIIAAFNVCVYVEISPLNTTMAYKLFSVFACDIKRIKTYQTADAKQRITTLALSANAVSNQDQE